MKDKNFFLLVDVWRKYNKEGLTKEDAEKAVLETLRLPWIQQINVFSDQVLCLLDLYTFNYLYISPSVEKILGYPIENFTGAKFTLSLMSDDESQLLLATGNSFMAKCAALKLQPSEMLRVRMTYNYFLKRKDGVMINLIQHNIPVLLNPQGLPLVQLAIASDITSFNNKPDHFYKAAIVNDDGDERVLFSGKMEGDEELISPREQEVLKLVSRGQSSESIADQLNISIETVKTHRKNLLEKSKAKDTIDLVRHGYANGWL